MTESPPPPQGELDMLEQKQNSIAYGVVSVRAGQSCFVRKDYFLCYAPAAHAESSRCDGSQSRMPTKPVKGKPAPLLVKRAPLPVKRTTVGGKCHSCHLARSAPKPVAPPSRGRTPSVRRVHWAEGS